MSEQTIKKLLLFWWSYYSKVTYTEKEKQQFEDFVKDDSEKMLRMAIEAHTFGFENAHIVQDMRENPFCSISQLTGYPKGKPLNPHYEEIRAAFLNEMEEQYITTFVKNESKASNKTERSEEKIQELVKIAKLQLGIPLYVAQENRSDTEFELQTLLLWWWKHYNQVDMSEQEDKMFHTFVEQDVNKALHLAIQESFFEMNPKAVLTIIRQDMLDEAVNDLPQISKNNSDYQQLCQPFLEKLTHDYYGVPQENESTPIGINWDDFTKQLAQSLSRIRKGRKNKYGNQKNKRRI
ncbi:MAG: hypothetical protein K2M17_01390 [Bacilli bacterium]|nr:hypothetical protein [Bacilli bacterium]